MDKKLVERKIYQVNKKANGSWKFWNRPDISYTTPGRTDNVYLEKFNKVKKFDQKRYLLWTIRDIMHMINESKIMDSSSTIDTFEAQFGKKITNNK